jgi:hypothetical protein
MTFLVVALAAGLPLAAVPAAGAWTWPANGPVLRPFSLGPDPYAGGQHRGVDIGAAEGEAVRAPVGGRVSFAGMLPGYGHTVTIRVDGLAVTLLHLGDLEVVRGADVKEGQPIAVAGPTGDAEQPTPYLHLGVRHADDDHGYVDPLTFLSPRVAPVELAPPAASPPVVPDPVAAAAAAAGEPPPAGAPAIAPAEPAAPAVPEAAPPATATPVAVVLVPRDQPAAFTEVGTAPTGGLTPHRPPSTAPRSAVAGSAQHPHARSLPHARRFTAATHPPMRRPLTAPTRRVDARPQAGRTTHGRAPGRGVRTAGPRLLSLVARADVPPAPTAAGARHRQGWAWAVAVALGVLAAGAAAAVARRGRKRAVPATRAPCPLGRRSTVAPRCSRRPAMPVAGCRPLTRSRARPRPAPRERSLVPA